MTHLPPLVIKLKDRTGTIIKPINFVLVLGIMLIGSLFIMVRQSGREHLQQMVELEVNTTSQNLYRMMVRDLHLAGKMSTPWDAGQPAQVVGDTLYIRFAQLDSVRYYLGEDSLLYREDVSFIGPIQSFIPEIDEDNNIKITVCVAASRVWKGINGSKLYKRTYEWRLILHESELERLIEDGRRTIG